MKVKSALPTGISDFLREQLLSIEALQAAVPIAKPDDVFVIHAYPYGRDTETRILDFVVYGKVDMTRGVTSHTRAASGKEKSGAEG